MIRKLFGRKTGEPAKGTHTKSRVLFVTLAALVVALGVLAGHPRPASAANGLEPILDCVTYDRDSGFVTAQWGYSNQTGVAITPAPEDNYFDPPPFYRGQPTTFQPGTYHNVFRTTFYGGDENDGYLSWILYGSTVTASNDRSKYCDGIPPNTAIIGGPTGTVNSSTATFELFATESGVTYECKLDDGDFAYCDTPEELNGLSDGTHTFQARATDRVGNTDQTPVTRTWTVDTTAPSPPSITSPANGAYDRDGSFNVRGTAEPGSVVRLYEGATRVGTDEADPSTGAWRVAVADISEGSHAYTARATDAIGNVSEDSAKTTVVVDQTAPTVTGVTPSATPRPSPNTNVTATFSERMDEESVEESGVFKLVKKGASSPVAAKVSYDPVTKILTLDPSANLKRGATYRATLTTGARDEAGNPLAAPKGWAFTVRR